MEAFAWLVARGLKFWFAALIEMEWTDEEVSLSKLQMSELMTYV